VSKVYGKSPTFVFDNEIGALSGSNIPIRLEIAARILASNYGDWARVKQDEFSGKPFSEFYAYLATVSLHLADALIAAHNSTQKADE
jgi:hypothetical protein